MELFTLHPVCALQSVTPEVMLHNSSLVTLPPTTTTTTTKCFVKC